MRNLLFALALGAVLGVLLATPAGAAPDRTKGPTSVSLIPRLYKNCTNFNKRYPHGVGRRLARDKTSGEPVTNFRRSTVLYRRAMSYNRGLDRDKDGIACEKK
jgi:Excalibur calcium-binding domain